RRIRCCCRGSCSDARSVEGAFKGKGRSDDACRLIEADDRPKRKLGKSATDSARGLRFPRSNLSGKPPGPPCSLYRRNQPELRDFTPPSRARRTDVKRAWLRQADSRASGWRVFGL